uniref:Uncharacterized protein n=1 Tax=Romanomermis culicivorax TaxID=13658 RepID=A0A915JF01_ROMCU
MEPPRPLCRDACYPDRANIDRRLGKCAPSRLSGLDARSNGDMTMANGPSSMHAKFLRGAANKSPSMTSLLPTGARQMEKSFFSKKKSDHSDSETKLKHELESQAFLDNGFMQKNSQSLDSSIPASSSDDEEDQTELEDINIASKNLQQIEIYLKKMKRISPEENPLTWWCLNQTSLPNLCGSSVNYWSKPTCFPSDRDC